MQAPKKTSKDVSRKILVGVLITLMVIILSLVSVLAVELVNRSRENKAASSEKADMESGAKKDAKADSKKESPDPSSGEYEIVETEETSAGSGESAANGDPSDNCESTENGDSSENSAAENGDSGENSDFGENSGSGKNSGSAENSNAPEASGEEETEGLFPVTTKAMTSDDIHKGILQLVNKQNEYLFLDGWLTDIENYDTYGFILSEWGMQMADVAAPYYCDFLNGFYEETGIYNIYMMNGYRTPEDAEFLFWRSAEENGLEHAEKYVMRAGFSEHHTGLASDLGLIEGGPYFEVISEEYQWVYDHAADYGFVLRYKEEKEPITDIGEETWHFRFVGIPCASYMYDHDLCLEEFLDEVRGHDCLNPILVTCTGSDGGDGEYAIYYQEGLVINVPENLEYEVSGNNMDGFVVIVKLAD